MATQTETVEICLDPVDIWGLQDTNIHQATGENPRDWETLVAEEEVEAGEAEAGVVEHHHHLGEPLEDMGDTGDKLFRQPSNVFTGDQMKTKEFLTQWELYYNLNHQSSIMGVPYSQCMLFLTFCKGLLMATWAATISHDISTRAQ